ncbi:MAG: hypothetical protein M1457_00810 [bacterium]|nr:hypothetical protein [bacterium]
MLPIVAIKRQGRRLQFDATVTVCLELERRGAEIEKRCARPAPGEDPLLTTGGPSPALERYRAARAELAEMDVKLRSREMIPREGMHIVLVRLGALLRNTLHQLEVEFGRGAYDIVESGLDEFDRELGACRITP